MKKLIFALGVSLTTLTASAANLAPSVTAIAAKKQAGKKVEIEAAKLPEKVTKSITETNKGKESQIVKAFQMTDAAGIVTGYEVVVLTDKKEEVFKFDKNGDVLKEVITPNPNAPKAEEQK